MGTEPLVAEQPWALINAFGGHQQGRQLTPYQRARLQLAQQKMQQQQQGGGVPSQPLNLDAQQDARQNADEYGYTPDVGASYAGIAPITAGGANNQLPTFARGAPGYNPQQTANLIQQKAVEHGIDPKVALAVAKSEGLGVYTGDAGSSFGPFQLHYGGVAGGGNRVGGLGDTFTKQTGLDARDPSSVPDQIDFALGQAKSGGWGPWHGWHGDPHAGLNGGQPINMDQQSTNVPTPPPRPQDVAQQQQVQQPEQVADDGDSTDPTTRLSWLV